MQQNNHPSFRVAQNYPDYLRYKEIKHNINISYHGINMADACAVDLINAIVVKSEESWYHVACALLQRVNLKPLRQSFLQYQNVFTYGTIGRKDHEELSHAIANSVEKGGWVRLEYIYRINRIISRGLYFWLKVRKLPISFVNRAYLSAKMAGYSCVVDELEKEFKGIVLERKQFIPFCAPICHEALFTLFFRKMGVRTYCTFHGMFGRYLHKIANDVVNGENIHTDYILAFGETPRQDLITDFCINAERIKVAGNPKYPYHPIQIKNTYTSALILGGIGLYDNELRELLIEVEKVGKKSNITFSLKPHPRSNIQNDGIWRQLKHVRLLDKSQTVQSLFLSNEFDFAITHNTTAYYESFIYGLKAFRWAKNENLDFEGLDDRFVDGQQLLKQISRASETPTEILSQEAEELLKRVLGYGINNYNQIINGALE